jgi:hypothetical protein
LASSGKKANYVSYPYRIAVEEIVMAPCTIGASKITI